MRGRLGAGGMGVVWAATAQDGTAVAIKVLARDDRDDARARFERESRLSIDHPNVTRILDAGITDDTQRYIVFELLDGHDLSDEIGAGTLDVAAVVDIGKQACAGLAAAHELGVVHRDVKPSNLFRCSDGTIKILDFGVARLLGSDSRLTTTGLVVGTPAFLSPEQARGDDDVDHRADVFGLGAVLYRALTGNLPFVKKNRLATLVAVIMQPFAPIRSVQPSVPASVAAVVERALAKRRDDRWPSAAAFGAALEAARNEAPDAPGAAPTSLLTADERRVVAVLLADGLEDRGAFGVAVEERGGHVVPVLGARAIGLFGVEAWAGDEILRACEAGLVARSAATRLSVASGLASVRDGAILGDGLEAAERACAAELRGLAIDTSAAAALADVEGLVRVRDSLYQLTGDRALRLGGRRITVGRTAELAQLSAAVTAVLEDEVATCLSIVGPPGIGKTHLVRLLTERIANQLTVLTARSRPHQRSDAFSLIVGAIVELLDELESTPSAQRDLVGRWLAAAVPSPDEVSAARDVIAELLGLPIDDAHRLAASHGDPQLLADRRRVALGDLFVGLASEGPLALILEDVQWADPDSLAVAEELIEILDEDAALMVATARDKDDAPALLSHPRTVVIAPRGLSKADVRTLGGAVRGEPIDPELANRLHARTGGNPLFVQHIAAAMDAGRDDLPMPPTVEAAVQAHLDRLSLSTRTACCATAVYGRAIRPSDLAALGVADADLHLGHLAKEGLLTGRRARSSGGAGAAGAFRFVNALVEDVAYRMLSDERRRNMHGLAADHLAEVDGGAHEDIAAHLAEAGNSTQAGLRYEDATAAAAARGDSRTVLRCAARAAASGSGPRDAFALHLAVVEAASFLGEGRVESAALDAATDAASTDREHALVGSAKIAQRSRAGDSAGALAFAVDAVDAARAAGDDSTLALTLGRRGVAAIYAGELGLAQEALQEATARSTSCNVHTQGLLAAWRAQLATAAGDLGARVDAFAEAVRLYREAHDLRRGAGAATNLADAYNRFGAYDDAAPALKAALSDCRRVGNRPMEGYALVNLGYALAGLGRADDADEAFAKAEAVADALGQPRLSMAAKIYRARAQLGASADTEAAARLATLGSQARSAGLPGLEISALVAAARAWLELKQDERALALAEAAMSLREELGAMEEDEAELFRTFADALDATGQHERADDARRAGAERVRAVAAGISDERWRRRFLEDVPANARLLR